MVVLLTGEAREVEDHDKVNVALVSSAVLQQALKLRPVSGLRALTFLFEAFEHLEALAKAVLLTRAELRGQTQVLCLLFCADPDVDDSADHRWQLKRVVGGDQSERGSHRVNRPFEDPSRNTRSR